MTVLLVTYDLNKPGQDYNKILDVIKDFDYVELCKSSYAVSVEKTEVFWGKIISTIDKSTNLYVFNLVRSVFLDHGTNEAKEWLENHL